jgi:hypothetical protein
MSNSPMKLQIFSFHANLTTFRARTNATPQGMVSSNSKNRIHYHSTFIATRESTEWHSSERTNITAGEIRRCRK